MEDFLKAITEFVSMPGGQVALGVLVLMLASNIFSIWMGSRGSHEAAGLTREAMNLLKTASEHHAEIDKQQRASESEQTAAMNRHTDALLAIQSATVGQQDEIQLIRGALENQTSLMAKFGINLSDIKRQNDEIIGYTGQTLNLVQPLPVTTSDTLMAVQSIAVSLRALESSLDVKLNTLTGAVETLCKRSQNEQQAQQLTGLAETLSEMKDALQDDLETMTKGIREMLARTARSDEP